MDLLGTDSLIPKLNALLTDAIEKSGGNLEHAAVTDAQAAIKDLLATASADVTALLQPILDRWDKTLDVAVKAEESLMPFASLAARLDSVLSKVEAILK